MCLELIPNHFVLIFLKDGCSLPPSSTEWHNHKNEKGEKPLQPQKESNKAEPILLDTPEKAK